MRLLADQIDGVFDQPDQSVLLLWGFLGDHAGELLKIGPVGVSRQVLCFRQQFGRRNPQGAGELPSRRQAGVLPSCLDVRHECPCDPGFLAQLLQR